MFYICMTRSIKSSILSSQDHRYLSTSKDNLYIRKGIWFGKKEIEKAKVERTSSS